MTRIKRSKRVDEVVDLSHSQTAGMEFKYSNGKLDAVKGSFKLFYGEGRTQYEFKTARITDEEKLEAWNQEPIGWIEEKLLQRAIDKIRVNDSN